MGARRGSYCLVALALALCHCRGESKVEREVIARAAGIPIYLDELRREYLRIRLSDDSGLPESGSELLQKKNLLQNMVDQRLLLQAAEQKSVLVSTDEVESAFVRAQSGWSEEEFQQVLKDRDLTPTEFKDELREQLVVRKYFREHVFSRVAVTDQEIEEYLRDHPEAYVAPEQVRARHIVVKTEEQAQKVLQEIRAGLSFEDAALKYSESPSGRSGGDLGLFARGTMPALFDQVCFSLPVGEVSKVSPSEDGFHLFKVLERKPETAKPVNLVRQEVEGKLRREKERLAEHSKLAELRKAGNVELREELLTRVH